MCGVNTLIAKCKHVDREECSPAKHQLLVWKHFLYLQSSLGFWKSTHTGQKLQTKILQSGDGVGTFDQSGFQLEDLRVEVTQEA